jgi:hypothetical protein
MVVAVGVGMRLGGKVGVGVFIPQDTRTNITIIAKAILMVDMVPSLMIQKISPSHIHLIDN